MALENKYISNIRKEIFLFILANLLLIFNFILKPRFKLQKEVKVLISAKISISLIRNFIRSMINNLIIRDFFDNRVGGIFIDVGCSHYKSYSTTYHLEKRLSWLGIGIDAISEYGFNYKIFRPKTKFFNFIVTNHSDTMSAFFQTEIMQLSSASEEYVRKRSGGKYKKIYVPTITLNKLLEQNGISKINFLSMDIEGEEIDALAGFDIKRFKPDLVCIETAHLIEKQILDYFVHYSYEQIDKYLAYDTVNWYFSPQS